MKHLRIVPLVLCLVGGGLSAASDRGQDRLDLTILHTNDLHGHTVPFAYTEKGRSPVEQPSVGGAARRATLVRTLRRHINHPTILVDAGDTFTRGALWNAYEGIADVEAMNAAGYELAALGNNEFKARDSRDRNDAAGSQQALLRVVKRARFPWVCANARDAKGAYLEGVQPFVVRSWNGVRVGFLGLTAPRSALYPQTRGWAISDPVKVAREVIPSARQQCDVLVAVTHLGVDFDRALVKQTEGIDAVVGGDSHTFLYHAVEEQNARGVRVPIVQDGEFGVNLGRFDLHLRKGADGRWSLEGYRYELLPIGPKLSEASDVKAVLEPFLAPFTPVVGHVDTVASGEEKQKRQVTEVLLAALRRGTGAELALSFPDSGEDVFHRREITRFDVYAAFPFHDRAVLVELTGTEIEAIRKAHPDVMLDGPDTPLQPARRYRVATIEMMAQSGFRLAADRLTPLEADTRELVIQELRRRDAAPTAR